MSRVLRFSVLVAVALVAMGARQARAQVDARPCRVVNTSPMYLNVRFIYIPNGGTAFVSVPAYEKRYVMPPGLAVGPQRMVVLDQGGQLVNARTFVVRPEWAGMRVFVPAGNVEPIWGP